LGEGMTGNKTFISLLYPVAIKVEKKNTQWITAEIYGKNPRHYVAVDCSIFGYEDGELRLLLYPRGFEPSQGKWSLMGGFVCGDESLEEAAGRVLFQTTGLHDIFLEQVSAFSKPDRDPGARVISVTFVALIRIDLHDKELASQNGALWWPVTKLPEMIFDHEDMVRNSLSFLQQKAVVVLLGKELLPEKFTLMQLRNLYEALFLKPIDPGNFRKKVLSLNVLERLDEKNTSESRKGAFYYRYQTPALDPSSVNIAKFP
jgi:ADP-ribose pyrophosphatase YjhB (NUDIX family)